MVFITFFDAGLQILSVTLVTGVLHMYDVKLVQLTPNSIVRLGIFECTLRAKGVEGSMPLFAHLHNARSQPKWKKGTNMVVNFGNVNF